MGADEVEQFQDREALRIFMKRLLTDLRALEYLLDNDHIEDGVRRIGAEQEIFLVDKSWAPASIAPALLETIDDPAHFTFELAQFNIECNLDPLPYGGTCLSTLEENLTKLIGNARNAAQQHDCNVLLAGILPTLQVSDLSMDNMTPRDRFYALNEAVTRSRGSNSYDLRVVGNDELSFTHDSIMIESCNTSFQIHFQVSRDEFVDFYNIGQAVAGPSLAASTNSGILFGHRLWEETRIAIFQQALETRGSTSEVGNRHSRVTFGTKWVDNSVIEIFQEDITRMRVLLGGDLGRDPFEEIESGVAPKLRALQLHNGTVYRWLRPCYGITDGIPHLRLENRFLPAGPTIVDEVANSALWFGLISGMRSRYGDVTEVMTFDTAKSNFVAAARHGLSAQFKWIDGRTIPAHALLREELIPLARFGLLESGIDPTDVDRYLGIIEERVSADTSGARWAIRSLSNMKDKGSERERLAAITAASAKFQEAGTPVHMWPDANLGDAGGWESNYLRAEQYMTTDVQTVHEDELIDLVACMMDWGQTRHIPVENDEHHVVGLVSYRSLLRLLAQGQGRNNEELVAVKDVMNPHPITVTPDTPTHQVIEVMRINKVACLPVVRDHRLLGIITERNFMGVAADLLREKLHAP